MACWNSSSEWREWTNLSYFSLPLWHYLFLLGNTNACETMKPQSYETFFRSDNWCGQLPLVIRQSEIAGSFLWQGPFNGKDMKKNNLPNSTKSDRNFFKVFWAHHGSWVSLAFFRGLLWMAVLICVQKLVWQFAGTLDFSLREFSLCVRGTQCKLSLFSTLSTYRLPRVCYMCIGLVLSHVKNILKARLSPKLHFCLGSVCTGVQL